MTQKRSQLAVVNSSLAIITMVITYALSFVYRTVLVKVMGVEYVGITGLCSNIINLFSLAELGISWAISFYLYKPLSENDQKTVAAIINLLKKLYRYIGLFIAIAGLVILPFLTTIAKSEHPIDNLHLIYLMFLTNTVLSYFFFAYYQILIAADRKNYILFKPSVLVPIFCTIFQISVLYFFHNFLLAVVVLCVSTLVKNLWMAWIGKKNYPYLQDYKLEKVSSELGSKIVKYIKATMIYKVSLTIQQSASSIIISSFIGVVVLGIYSNFVLIVDTIKSLILNMINPMTAIIGEINASESIEYKETIYKRLNLLMEWICCLCSVCLFVLMNPFVELWLGKDFLLPISTVSLIVFFFYFEFITAFSTKFRDACGLNHIGKFRPLFTALITVVLSLVLVRKMELNGVLVAMIIARITTITWFEPWIIHKFVIQKSVIKYYIELVLNLILTIGLIIGIYWIYTKIWDSGILIFIVLCIICLILPILVMILFYNKTEAYTYYKQLICGKLKDKWKK